MSPTGFTTVSPQSNSDLALELLQKMPLSMLMLDEDDRISWWNERFERHVPVELQGLLQQRPTYRQWLEALAPIHISNTQHGTSPIRDEISQHACRIWVEERMRSHRSLETTGHRFEDRYPDGELLLCEEIRLADKLVIVGREIGGDQLYREVVSRLQKSLWQVAPVAIAVTSQSGHISLLNETCAQLLSIPDKEAAIGQQIANYLPDDLASSMMMGLRAGSVPTREVKINQANDRWAVFSMQPGQWDGRKQLFWIALDITEQYLGRDASSLMQTILNVGGISAIDVNVKTGKGRATPQLWKLLGETPPPARQGAPAAWREMNLKWLTDYFAPSDLGEFLQRIRTEGEPIFRWQGRIIAPDGQERYLNLRGQLDAHRLIGIIEDISQRYLADVDRQKALASAEAGERARSDFISLMSHEIRGPLAAVHTTMEIVQQQLLAISSADGSSTTKTTATKTMVDRLSKIVLDGRDAVGTLLSILTNILDYSRMERGILHVTPTITNLSDVRRAVISLWRRSAEAKGLTLRWHEEPGIAQQIMIDGGRLKQVLLNLVGNAVKFTQTGTIVVSVSSDIAGDRLKFLVIDSGPGMDREHLERLFMPFEQSNRAVTRRFSGTGLGLAICKLLVEAMGGTIRVESSAGGTKFAFDLPAPPISSIATNNTSIGYEPPTLLENTKTILLVDDTELARELAVMQLEVLGLQVDVAGSVTEALILFDPTKHAAILTDLHMPERSGADLALAIRERDDAHSIPIVALTADINPEQQVDISMFDAVLTKPAKAAEIIHALRLT